MPLNGGHTAGSGGHVSDHNLIDAILTGITDRNLDDSAWTVDSYGMLHQDTGNVSGLVGSNAASLVTYKAFTDASSYGGFISTRVTITASAGHASFALVGIGEAAPNAGTNLNGSYGLIGAYGVGRNVGPGDVTSSIGVLGNITNSAGVTTAGRALSAQTPVVSAGSITTAYGLYIEGQQASGVGTGYGIYQVSASDTNFLAGKLVMGDAANFEFNTTTGTKIGTSTSQKLAFYNSTPIAKQTGVAVTAAGIHAALVSLGLIAA